MKEAIARMQTRKEVVAPMIDRAGCVRSPAEPLTHIEHINLPGHDPAAAHVAGYLKFNLRSAKGNGLEITA